jgi:hypothetical protein
MKTSYVICSKMGGFVFKMGGFVFFSAPFTIGADTDWADQIDSRAAYLSRANNYLLKSYVLQKYSKGAEVNICGTKC